MPGMPQARSLSGACLRGSPGLLLGQRDERKHVRRGLMKLVDGDRHEHQQKVWS